MWFNGANYIFRKNLQGDVVGICDSNGNLLGSYTYDAWGKILSSGTATIFSENPFRFRGYYYDTETQLYYLQTRYYDPETGRFLNEDAYSYLEPETVNGLNLYAYCLNNPVMGADPEGNSIVLTMFLGFLIGYAVSFVFSAMAQAIVNEDHCVNWAVAAIDGAFGGLSSALWMIPGLGPVATGFINAGLSAVNGILTTGIQNEWQYTWQDAVSITVSSGLSGLVSWRTRQTYFSIDGKNNLKKAQQFIGTILKNAYSGKYNNGVDIFSKSFKSAMSQMGKVLLELNFDKGFYKDWLSVGLQAMFSATFSRGLDSLVW